MLPCGSPAGLPLILENHSNFGFLTLIIIAVDPRNIEEWTWNQG
jgi:hypothetical protein